MYKIIAMDFDDTILTSDKIISEYSKNILNKYKNEGYVIVGVTGRSLSSAMDTCDINIFDYLILNNGTHIYDVKKDESECINLISKEICFKITSLASNLAYKFDYCSLNNYYMTTNSTFNKPFLIHIDDLSQVNDEICKMNIFLNDNNVIEDLVRKINSEFDVSAFIMQDSSSEEKWVVINPKNLNKCTTIQILCKKFNLTLDNVIFFGDGLNDIELIKNAGLGVAMGNALPIVKENAKDITLNNNEDGVAKYLLKVLK